MASKLTQMQARFQQKQMQEKEEKLLKLYENQQQRAFERVGRGSAGSNASTTSVGSTGGGKVRQMFDERRQKAGIDKSYPLEPIKTKSTSKSPGFSKSTITSRTTTVKTTAKKTVNQQALNEKPAVNKLVTHNNNYANGNYIVNGYDEVDNHKNLIELMNKHNLYDLDTEELPQIGFNDNYQEKPLYASGKLANVGGKLPSEKSKLSSHEAVSHRNDALKQEVKVTNKKTVSKTATPARSTSSVSSASSQSLRNSPSRSENMSSKQVQPQTSQSSRAPTSNRPSAKQLVKSPVVRDDLAECRYCGRRFATDRLGTHEDICGKTGKKKRKSYDASKHRVQGTELESYVLKGPKKGATGRAPAKQAAPKNNWRRTHEEFISAIKAAKQAQAYVAKGGKLADLPPPPPASNPDYVQCPHCGRRFNEAAAERHIPKCADFQFNKPKSNPKSKPMKR